MLIVTHHSILFLANIVRFLVILIVLIFLAIRSLWKANFSTVWQATIFNNNNSNNNNNNSNNNNKKNNNKDNNNNNDNDNNNNNKNNSNNNNSNNSNSNSDCNYNNVNNNDNLMEKEDLSKNVFKIKPKTKKRGDFYKNGMASNSVEIS